MKNQSIIIYKRKTIVVNETYCEKITDINIQWIYIVDLLEYTDTYNINSVYTISVVVVAKTYEGLRKHFFLKRNNKACQTFIFFIQK